MSVNFGTHEGRIKALEEAYELAPSEQRAAIVAAAAEICNREENLLMSRQYSGAALSGISNQADVQAKLKASH